MSHRGNISGEPTENEEEEEVTELGRENSNKPLKDEVPDQGPAVNESANSNNESGQSLVGKLRNNVSTALAKMIQTARKTFVSSARLHDCGNDRAEIQPAKRPRLQQTDDEGDQEFTRGSQSIIVCHHPLPDNRVDRETQTIQSDTALLSSNYSHANRARYPVPFQGYGESNVFRTPVSNRKQPAERARKRQREEDDENVEEAVEEKEEEREDPHNARQRLGALKFGVERSKLPYDQRQRLTDFLGNRCYQQNQQQLHRGLFGNYFFYSHHKPTKNLDSASSSETNSSFPRPSFSRSAASGQRITPEYGGSMFYKGCTRYGGASAVNRLYTYSTQTRSQNNDVLIRKPDSLSHSSNRKNDSSKSNAHVASDHVNPVEMTNTAQRIMKILQDFDQCKKSTKKVKEQIDPASCAWEFAGNSRIPRMFQILHEQNLDSVRKARSDNYPPTLPLMNVRPLYAHQPIDRREESASSDRSLATEATNKDTNVGNPVLEEEEKEVRDKETTNKDTNVGSPVLEEEEKDVRDKEATNKDTNVGNPVLEEEEKEVRDKETTNKDTNVGSPVLEEEEKEVRDKETTNKDTNVGSPVLEEEEKDVRDKEATNKDTNVGNPVLEEEEKDVRDKEVRALELSVLTDEDTDDQQQQDPPMQKIVTSSPIRTNVHIEEVPLFTFSEPILLDPLNEQGTDSIDTVPLQLSIKFDEPELLQPEEPRTNIRSFQELMAESASKWICDVCMVRNEPHQLACVACESANPSKKQQQPPPLPISTSSSSSFAAIVSAQSSRWECDACCIRNKPSAVVCVCCGMAKSNGGTGGAPVTATTPSKNPTTVSPFSSMPGTLAHRKKMSGLRKTSNAKRQGSSGQQHARGSVRNTTTTQIGQRNCRTKSDEPWYMPVEEPDDEEQNNVEESLFIYGGESSDEENRPPDAGRSGR
ncbi:uncharacterized protein LOC126563406 [Anopheles maculipalpis]|uniref:uncharacterized protein LOC126563406 n=1 Tax=Anopheles maculipalpis TaxID=1496333 RepID=UPI002158FB89|nr:uncharacterized protein LOC126563406 [Anopheles maculipalpis]